ncbi:MAG: nicotinate-nucleotide adenylyltransferase [Terracidiphilus sp.]|jgi:nicotinate-nucleotide adenylyltransferase
MDLTPIVRGAAFFGGSRVAFFGGSFDPPHFGHLAVARAAQRALGLDTVLFAPVGAQPLKPDGSTACFEDRLAMTQLAIADQPGFTISMADAPRAQGAPNFTIETLLALRADLPPEGTLFCLIGADSFAGLKHWHRAAEIPFAAPLIVAARPGQSLADLKALLPDAPTVEPNSTADEMNLQSSSLTKRTDSASSEKLSKEGKKRQGTTSEADFQSEKIELVRYTIRNASGARTPLYLLPGLEIPISASEIREKLRLNEPHLDLLPAPVLDYIRAHNLYRDLLPSL